MSTELSSAVKVIEATLRTDARYARQVWSDVAAALDGEGFSRAVKERLADRFVRLLAGGTPAYEAPPNPALPSPELPAASTGGPVEAWDWRPDSSFVPNAWHRDLPFTEFELTKNCTAHGGPFVVACEALGDFSPLTHESQPDPAPDFSRITRAFCE